jgi:hypothetical protein
MSNFSMAGTSQQSRREEPLLREEREEEEVAAELGAAAPRGVLAGSVGESSGAAYASELNFGVACNVETVADEWATGLCDCCAAPASRYVYVRVCTHVSASTRFFLHLSGLPPGPSLVSRLCCTTKTCQFNPLRACIAASHAHEKAHLTLGGSTPSPFLPVHSKPYTGGFVSCLLLCRCCSTHDNARSRCCLVMPCARTHFH